MSSRPRAPLVAVALVALLGTSLLAGCDDAEDQVVVGAGQGREQAVLAAVAVAALEEAGLEASVREVQGQTAALRRRARAGAIDLFWDYTGAAWALGLGEQAPPADPVESFERVRTSDLRTDLRWLGPTDANATLALFVRAADLPPAGEDQSLTWLAARLSSGGSVCADPDFLDSPAGLAALAVEYAINLDQVEQVPLAEDAALAALAEGECTAALGTATSGEAVLADLVPVADVQSVFPAFVVAPVAHLPQQPVLLEQVQAALQPVTAALDTATLAQLNAEAAVGAEAAEVAGAFVASLGDATAAGG